MIKFLVDLEYLAKDWTPSNFLSCCMLCFFNCVTVHPDEIIILLGSEQKYVFISMHHLPCAIKLREFTTHFTESYIFCISKLISKLSCLFKVDFPG